MPREKKQHASEKELIRFESLNGNRISVLNGSNQEHKLVFKVIDEDRYRKLEEIKKSVIEKLSKQLD